MPDKSKHNVQNHKYEMPSQMNERYEK